MVPEFSRTMPGSAAPGPSMKVCSPPLAGREFGTLPCTIGEPRSHTSIRWRNSCPRAQRSHLLPLWRVSGWPLGAIPAALSKEATFAAIAAAKNMWRTTASGKSTSRALIRTPPSSARYSLAAAGTRLITRKTHNAERGIFPVDLVVSRVPHSLQVLLWPSEPHAGCERGVPSLNAPPVLVNLPTTVTAPLANLRL